MAMHRCPGRGCARSIGSNEFACPPCWRKLPAHLRTTISNSYRHDQPATHTDAVAAANAWYGTGEVTD